MALYRNREKLREMGVLFPMLHWNLKNGQQPSKGNAKHLARWLMSDEASSKDQVFRRVIECCTQTDATRTVLSSEQMFMFKPKNMAMFVEALDAAGIDVKFVFYVRSIADIALSRQAQLLRRNKDPAARSLGDILSRRLLFKEAIEKLLRLTEPSKLNVRSYDNASEDLPGDFLVNGVALSPEETSQLDLELPRANPSLLGRELHVMEVVNKLLVRNNRNT